MSGAGSTHGGTREMQTEFWWGHLKERDHVEDLVVRLEDNIKMGIQEVKWGYGLD